MNLNIQDTFNKELPADKITENTRRQVTEACFSYATPRVPSAPKVIHVSEEMLRALNISTEEAASEEFQAVFSGAKVLDGTAPYAMCYGGHQFGHWAGQLGDGRAINLCEVKENNQRWALQLKGAGETPYSRTADGLAVLRSSIREHLCSEAMFHLGVPTTRSLSLSITGDEVMRDMMYDGNAAYEKGAVVCRVSPSFIRFGNFQIFAARQDHDNLRKLTDYTIKHFFKEITAEGKEKYIQFLEAVAKRTLEMVVHWQRVGFVHGVMNTDNMSILGLTIDYGPYGWLEPFDPDWTPNTTDKQGRRYRFGNQPEVSLWNLFQLANALYPLIEAAAPLEAILNQYKADYAEHYFDMMRKKNGFSDKRSEDVGLITELEKLLHLAETDMTIFFRNLANIEMKEKDAVKHFEVIKGAFYAGEDLTDNAGNQWKEWLQQYVSRLNQQADSDAERKVNMNLVNPKYVLRNYMAQLAIDKADEGDYSLIAELHEVLKKPYDEQPVYEKWFSLRPEWARHKVGCSMLSCSS